MILLQALMYAVMFGPGSLMVIGLVAGTIEQARK